MSLHIDYCAGFGISVPEIEATEEKQACTAYTRYVLDVGQSEDWIALQMALAPCRLGYGAVAQQLHADAASVRGEGNRYWNWIENYVAEDYVGAVRIGSALLERHAALQSPSSIERLVKIFIHGTKVSPKHKVKRMELTFVCRWRLASGKCSRMNECCRRGKKASRNTADKTEENRPCP
jgi:thiaminase